MRNIVNIKGNNQVFQYLVEYSKSNIKTDGDDIVWASTNNGDTIHLLQNAIKYYRNNNNWYHVNTLSTSHSNIPNLANTSSIKIYLPEHSVKAYVGAVKYIVTANTWINGKKINLGSYVFKHNDAIAINTGTIKKGNNEYHELVEFDIIDPFYLMYSDDWIPFRNKVCGEPLGLNNTGSSLYVSIFVVDESNDGYTIKDNWIGGYTNFYISDNTEDMLTLNLSESLDPLGLQVKLNMNSEYDWLLTYLDETYGLNIARSDLKYELVIKNKDSIIPGPIVGYAADEYNGFAVQTLKWESISNDNAVKTFFSSWDNYEEGWNFVTSLTAYDKFETDDQLELFTVVSNELPITQNLFSKLINGGAKKIIDLNDMNITQYNVVNKIENKIVQIERPNASKDNIVQPVFYRVKDLETLTLHPIVTENICINLDDYKSKTGKFTLLIEGCKFEQIGANKYGILFKITANTIPASAISGTYYVLDANEELITTGKYTCIR